MGCQNERIHAQALPMFNTHRMVSEYWDRFYLPAAERGAQLMEREWENLKKLAKWREKVMYNWTHVAIQGIRLPEISEAVVGQGYTSRPIFFSGNCSRKMCWWRSMLAGWIHPTVF